MSNPGQGGPQMAEDFFAYVASFGNLAPAAVSVQNINIQADSDFEWIMSTASGNLNGGTAPFSENIILPINITIQDSGSGRVLFSQAMPLTMFAGNGKQPFILPVSRLFLSKSNISINAVNADAANTYNNVFLSFIGRKIFQLSR